MSYYVFSSLSTSWLNKAAMTQSDSRFSHFPAHVSANTHTQTHTHTHTHTGIPAPWQPVSVTLSAFANMNLHLYSHNAPIYTHTRIYIPAHLAERTRTHLTRCQDALFQPMTGRGNIQQHSAQRPHLMLKITPPLTVIVTILSTLTL